MKTLVSTVDLPFEDWLEYRKQGLGGSDASVVCGVNRYKSPVELWFLLTATWSKSVTVMCRLTWTESVKR
jgi:predicted phage-related endonuclease